jgi:uncharacterized protein (TIGR00369 family)
MTSHFRSLEAMYHGAPINTFFGPVIEVAAAAATVRMKVRADFHHAASAAHGSVYFKMLDDAAFFAVQSQVEDVFVLTLSFNVHLLAPVSEGEMVSEGRVVHQSKRLFVADSTIQVGGKTVARGNGTFMRSAVRLDAQVGYK